MRSTVGIYCNATHGDYPSWYVLHMPTMEPTLYYVPILLDNQSVKISDESMSSHRLSVGPMAISTISSSVPCSRNFYSEDKGPSTEAKNCMLVSEATPHVILIDLSSKRLGNWQWIRYVLDLKRQRSKVETTESPSLLLLIAKITILLLRS